MIKLLSEAMSKVKRRVDETALDATRLNPCVVCGNKSDAAHIKSRGAGGDDTGDNLISLCRVHHSLQHHMGWRRFGELHPTVMLVLMLKGWQVCSLGKLRRR